MKVCPGPGPIIEEVEEEEEAATSVLSSPPKKAHYTPQEPFPITTGQTSNRTPPGPLTYDVNLVSVNSLYYNVNIFNITPYIQIKLCR